MKTYHLDSNKKFIWSEGYNLIWVSILDNPEDPLVGDCSWKHQYDGIGQGEEYDSLEVFGVVLRGGSLLEKLAQKLSDSCLIVNREGFSMFSSANVVSGNSFSAQFYRLNDLFNWSEFTVKLPEIKTVWNRCSLEEGKVVICVGNGADSTTKGIKPSKGITPETIIDDDKAGYCSIPGCGCGGDGGEVSELEDSDGEDVPNDREDPNDSLLVAMANQNLEDKKEEIPSDRFSVSYITRQRFAFRFTTSGTLPEYTPVNEKTEGNFPVDVNVYTSKGDFDRKLWWAIKMKHGNETCMLAYYGGSHAKVDYGSEDIFLPYDPEARLSTNTEFFLAQVNGYGVALAFKYN